MVWALIAGASLMLVVLVTAGAVSLLREARRDVAAWKRLADIRFREWLQWQKECDNVHQVIAVERRALQNCRECLRNRDRDVVRLRAEVERLQGLNKEATNLYTQTERPDRETPQ